MEKKKGEGSGKWEEKEEREKKEERDYESIEEEVT